MQTSLFGIVFICRWESIVFLSLMALAIYPWIGWKTGAPRGRVIGATFVASLLLYLTIGLHELGHMVVANWFGFGTNAVSTNWMGFSVDLDEAVNTADSATKIAILAVGPLVTFLAAAFFILGGRVCDRKTFFVPSVLGYLSLLTGILNLFPLPGSGNFVGTDGGQLLALLLEGVISQEEMMGLSLLSSVLPFLLVLAVPRSVKIRLKRRAGCTQL